MIFADNNSPSQNPVGAQFNDVPGSYWFGACGFAYADGHAEIHKWLDSTTKVPMQQGGKINGTITDTAGNDYAWMSAHCSQTNSP